MVVPELMAAGHEVLGLARSDVSAQALTAAGASVLRGDLSDHESLRAGAVQSDGVIHLAFGADFNDFEKSVARETG
ncbi:MAG TPA: NAD-dependent epimerase/dehydratase family protein, partial [Acidimicrobiales bacterium]|nr:NAD-dependent epimerase/dehydratase family protein [Acidimicrobiales bacterium]